MVRFPKQLSEPPSISCSTESFQYTLPSASSERTSNSNLDQNLPFQDKRKTRTLFHKMWATPSPPWAANPLPGQTRYENNPPDISASILGVGVFCTITALIVVCLRLYTRIFIVRGLKADDCQSASVSHVQDLKWPSR